MKNFILFLSASSDLSHDSDEDIEVKSKQFQFYLQHARRSQLQRIK